MKTFTFLISLLLSTLSYADWTGTDDEDSYSFGNTNPDQPWNSYDRTNPNKPWNSYDRTNPNKPWNNPDATVKGAREYLNRDRERSNEREWWE